MRALMVALCVALAGTTLAAEPIDIGWRDLAPRLDTSANPYYGLTANESRMLGILVEIADAKASGRQISPLFARGEELAIAALASVGLDGVALARQVKRFGAQLDASRVETNAALDGNTVQLAGFIWPLAMDGARIKEFVLVPYAGACVHTPPPPPNQIVIVSTADGLEIDSLFTAVAATGRLAIETQEFSVDFRDGSSAFESSYSLEASDLTVLKQS